MATEPKKDDWVKSMAASQAHDELAQFNRGLRQYVLIACGVIVLLAAMACGTLGYVVYAVTEAFKG